MSIKSKGCPPKNYSCQCFLVNKEYVSGFFLRSCYFNCTERNIPDLHKVIQNFFDFLNPKKQ